MDSTIVANDRWLGPLARDRAARFYAETVPLGRAFGVPADRLPADLDAFEGYLASMLSASGPVHPDDTARELADAILRPPLPGVLGRLPLPPELYAWSLWPALGLLPPTVREEFGSVAAAGQQLVSRWLVAGWRAWRPLLPAAFREMPQALAADRRIARERAPRPTVSRSSGTAARTSSRPGSSGSPRRTR